MDVLPAPIRHLRCRPGDRYLYRALRGIGPQGLVGVQGTVRERVPCDRSVDRTDGGDAHRTQPPAHHPLPRGPFHRRRRPRGRRDLSVVGGGSLLLRELHVHTQDLLLDAGHAHADVREPRPHRYPDRPVCDPHKRCRRVGGDRTQRDTDRRRHLLRAQHDHPRTDLAQAHRWLRHPGDHVAGDTGRARRNPRRRSSLGHRFSDADRWR